MLSINYMGTDYSLATNLRVAYTVQGQHNHKPYTEVFKNIGDMTVEDQLGIIYCSFKCANPDTIVTREQFQNYLLDNMNLKDMLDVLQSIIKGVMGTDENADEPEQATTADSGN